MHYFTIFGNEMAKKCDHKGILGRLFSYEHYTLYKYICKEKRGDNQNFCESKKFFALLLSREFCQEKKKIFLRLKINRTLDS